MEGAPPPPPPARQQRVYALRPDQTRRANAWFAARAAAAGVAPHAPPLPSEAHWEDVAARPELTATVLAALEVQPSALIASGAPLDDLVARGYDAAALVDSALLCTQMSAAYGRVPLACAVLKTSSDAVMLAGSDAADRLGISTRSLLRACAGSANARLEAVSVLDQVLARHAQRDVGPIALRHPLSGMPVAEIANLGLDAKLLLERYQIPVGAMPALFDTDWAGLACVGVVQCDRFTPV